MWELGASLMSKLGSGGVTKKHVPACRLLLKCRPCSGEQCQAYPYLKIVVVRDTEIVALRKAESATNAHDKARPCNCSYRFYKTRNAERSFSNDLCDVRLWERPWQAMETQQDDHSHRVVVVWPTTETMSRQQLPDYVGISEVTAGAKNLSMNLIIIPPGGAAEPRAAQRL